MPYAIGVDYGTNSVRALVVDTTTGTEVAAEVFAYPSGEAGILLDPADPNLARQNPADYQTGFLEAVRAAVASARKTVGLSPDDVVGIGVDTTGSTPIPVDASCVPLAFQERFKDNLAAQAWLWKDHTGYREAEEITEAVRAQGLPYLAKCGGTYSSEWYWSKLLHCKRTAPEVFDAAVSWVELADFIPGWLTEQRDPATLPRGVCAAGHKAFYHPDWGGYPSADFLASLDPDLPRLLKGMPATALPSSERAGGLDPTIAAEVGLRPGTPVAVGAFDAHMGAVGAGVRPGVLVKTIGTSTCDTMVVPLSAHLPDIPGLCGIVPESILPGHYGLEAGQSAVGDLFNWFVANLAGPGRDAGAVHAELTDAALSLAPGESGLLALDWNHGNRTILVDPLLSGLLIGQTLHTTAADIYRALIEATAFGALTIMNRIGEYGVEVQEVIACGGIAEKNPLVMQIYADVCNRPIRISRSSQTCALGAAVFGAVVGGAHPDTPTAQQAMTGIRETAYVPDPANTGRYARLYELYKDLHDAFGVAGSPGGLAHVMKELIAIRQEARRGKGVSDA